MPVKSLPDTIQIPAGSTVQTAGMQGVRLQYKKRAALVKAARFLPDGIYIWMQCVLEARVSIFMLMHYCQLVMSVEIVVARSATSPASAPCLHLAEYFLSPRNNVSLVRIAVNLEAVRDNVCAKGFQLFFNGIHCAAEIGV